MQSMSIHVGLNEVDAQVYRGWRGELHGAENDARCMAALAEAQGIATRQLIIGAEATYRRVKSELAGAAARLSAGDYLLLTFAGHGAQLEEIPTQAASASAANDGAASAQAKDADIDEEDGIDEAWCLYDTYMLDDELHALLCKFAAGVRICVVSDSCFSGTVTRGERATEAATLLRPELEREPAPHGRPRRIAPRLGNALYRRNFVNTYLPRIQEVADMRDRGTAAHVLLLAGCEDGQTVVEREEHGVFTEQLIKVWDGGRFTGSHRELIEEIRKGMPRRQQPALFVHREQPEDGPFLNSRPFTPAL